MITFGIGRGVYTFGLRAADYLIHYTGTNCVYTAEDGNEFQVKPGTNFVTVAPEYFDVTDLRNWRIYQNFNVGIVSDSQTFIVDETRTWIVDPADLLTDTAEDDYTVSDENTFIIERECNQ